MSEIIYEIGLCSVYRLAELSKRSYPLQIEFSAECPPMFDGLAVTIENQMIVAHLRCERSDNRNHHIFYMIESGQCIPYPCIYIGSVMIPSINGNDADKTWHVYMKADIIQ